MSQLTKLLDGYTVRVGPISPEDGGGFRATYEELGLSVAGYGAVASAAIAQLAEVAQESLADEPVARSAAAPLRAALGPLQRPCDAPRTEGPACAVGPPCR